MTHSFGGDERKLGYWLGFYDACRLLTTSPRMNGPQIEVIEEQAYRAKAELEQRGVTFTEAQLAEPEEES